MYNIGIEDKEAHQTLKNQMIFKRYEIKYLLTSEQRQIIQEKMTNHMKLDAFGHSIIRNIYFDTDNYRLARRSIEKPIYKEKLRMRSYKAAEMDEPVFLELKKKYQSVVYKRRILLPQKEAFHLVQKPLDICATSQIQKEMVYFCDFYNTLKPVLYLSYEREAYYVLDGSDFRVTFDEQILGRTKRLSLYEPVHGQALIPCGMSIMEIKTPGGIPLWMTECLTNLHVYQTSYSKYGTAYQKIIKNNFSGGINYANVI